MRYKIFIGLLVTLCLLGINFGWLFLPLEPRSWREVIPGMTEKEVVNKLSGHFDSPIGLEENRQWEEEKEFSYGVGANRAFCGINRTLVITYDKTGREGGILRKALRIQLKSERIPFFVFIENTFNYFY